jgi:hypothetical protein
VSFSAVTLEAELFSDRRLDLLSRSLGCSPDEALGRLARLWSCAYARGAATLPVLTVEAVLGDRGHRALVAAELGEMAGEDVELRGVARRLARREARLASVSTAGSARAKSAIRDARGRLVARDSVQRDAGGSVVPIQRDAGRIQRDAGKSPASHQRDAGVIQRDAGENPASHQRHAGDQKSAGEPSTSVTLEKVQRPTSVTLVNIFEQREREEEEIYLSAGNSAQSAPAGDLHPPSQPLPSQETGRRRAGRPRSGKAPLAPGWMPEVAPATPWERDQLARFRDHFVANGKAMASWDAAWRNWLRRAPEFAPASSRPASSPVRRLAPDTRTDAEIEADTHYPPDLIDFVRKARGVTP